jgi:electron transport complex protein RnfG
MKKEGPIKNALILCAITLVAGVLLSFVYQLTLTPIQQAQLAAQAAAYVEVYADAASFGTIDGSDEMIANSAQAIADAGYTGASIDDVMSALDENGNVIGYVLSATSKNGYGGDVTIALGLDLDGVITGFKPLEHSETPGFGARCEEESYRATFPGVSSVEEVDAISGATYTTGAIREAVGAAFCFVQNNLL